MRGRIRLAIGLAAVIPSFVFACQPCLLWQVPTLRGRLVVRGTVDDVQPVPSAKVVLREAIERAKDEPHPGNLSCSDYYRMGKIVYSGTSDRQGLYDPGVLSKGLYWLAVRGESVELVRLISYKPGIKKNEEPRAVDYEVSEGGFVSGMCGIENIEEYLKENAETY